MVKVSVCLITYKQERYITKSLESVLAQKTDFPFEIVIGDDCSPDQTRPILQGYASRFPEKIRLLDRPSNLGMHGNFADTLHQCRGEYIAILEGDDFWTDHTKLQRQAELLDANPNYSACFTRAGFYIDEEAEPTHFVPGSNPEKHTYHTADLIAKNYIATCTMMLKRKVLTNIDFVALTPLSMIDWPLWLLYAQAGPIGYIDDAMGGYRYHQDGIWSGQKNLYKLQKKIEAHKVMRRQLARSFNPQFDHQIIKTEQRIAQTLLKEGNRQQARYHIWCSLYAIPPSQIFTFKRYLKQAAFLLLRSISLKIAAQ